MSAHLIFLFLWVMLGFAALAFLETTVEGEQGGGEGTKGWRKELLGYRVKEYHFWLWYVVVPVFVFSPLVVTGPDLLTFATLASAYLLGGILEDFLYFVANPHYGVKRWRSSEAPWMPWFRIGRVEVPQFYVRNAILTGALWAIVYLY